MSTEYLTVSDHDLTIVIPGEVASVRARLVEALQQVGYKIIAEQPLTAKRGKQGSAKWDCSINVLDYQTNLTIGLKQTNDAAVLATFNYEIKSYMCMTKGDRKTLACEAEAIAALTTERLTLSACRSCGTQVTDESNFCRRCGAPLVVDVPELEVLRLTKSVRGSYHTIFVGMMAMLAALLTVVPIFIVRGGIYGPLFWVGVPFATYGLFMLLNGLWQLHRTLNPNIPKSVTTTQPAFVNPVVTTALPPRPVNASVTEVTTSLLSPVRDQRVKEPIHRKDADTSEIDTDHLM